MTKILKHALLLFASFAIVAFVANHDSAFAESLSEIRHRLGIDIESDKISVSGVSSGGFMANQIHLAHSSRIMGVGILAAGPYACGRSSSFWCDMVPTWYGFWMPHDSCQALHACSHYLGIYLGPPGHGDSVVTAEAEAMDGGIDALHNLSGDRVWLFWGTADDLVPEEVVNDLAEFYSALFARPDVVSLPKPIIYESSVAVKHAMVVADPGIDDCLRSGPPFINDCSFDAAGEMLTYLYDLDADTPGPVERGAWNRNALFAFDQRDFFDQTDPSLSLNAQGHLYVPEGCRHGARCPLHIALHGCGQHEKAVVDACGGGQCPMLMFFEDAGYNEWADAYGIVLLYPQTTVWGLPLEGHKNPQGCWDWWGYTGPDYFRNTGKQIVAVDQMIDCLTGARPCP